MAKLVAFEVKVSFPSECVSEQAAENTMNHNTHSNGSSKTYRMSLCNAMPREIIGVMSVRSDMLVSAQEVSDQVHLPVVISLLTHLLIHEPKGNRLVSNQCLIVALGIGNTLFSPAAILKSPADAWYIPVLVVELF